MKFLFKNINTVADDFVTQDEPIFHEIFKIFVVINQKLCGVWG